MTVTDAITSYLDHLAVERGTARNTLDGYARDLRRYEQHLAVLGVPTLETVREAHVSAFLAVLRSGTDEHPAPASPKPSAWTWTTSTPPNELCCSTERAANNAWCQSAGQH